MRAGGALPLDGGELRRRDPVWIGRYQILRRLGAGGMATVYLANDKRGRAVAVKVLHEHLRDDPVFRDRFSQEVTTARRVASFCTARVLDAHVRGRTPFIVTEYVDGMSLHEWMARNGTLSTPDTEALAVGVAAALTAIHTVGLAHRDLKPANVMLSPLGPKVIDFGIAGAANHITTGVRFGTPGWLAPEQLSGQPGSPAGDVYAWGLLVAWAASGHHPQATASQDLSMLSPRLQPLVRAALSLDPSHRPTARQLVLNLCGSDRSAKVQAATAPTTWQLQQPDTRAPKGSDHLAAAYAKAGRRPEPRTTRPMPAPTLVAARAGKRRNARPAPVAQPIRMPRRRRRSGWKAAIVLVVLLAGAAVLPDRSQKPGAGTVPAEPAPGRAPANPRAAAKTGRDGSLAFTVTALRCGETQLGDWPVTKQAKGQFCLIDLRVKNAGKHTGWVFMGSQQLVDAAGKKYGADDWSWVYYAKSRPFTSTVGSGATVEGTLVFDVPAQTRFTKLIVHDTPLSDGTALSLK